MAKTIFNTSEKSNFILNLTEEKYSSMASKALAAACVLVSLFTIPVELLNTLTYSFVTAGLAVGGVLCMILMLIAFIKKYVSKKLLIPVCAFGFMLIWGAVSLADSYSFQLGFYGMEGRGEGLLALIFYFCFFVTGLTLKTENSVKTLITAVIATGLLNSVWGIVQVFTGMGSYKHLSLTLQPNAASGLVHSPIFLAMLLTLSLAAAVIGAVMSDNKIYRLFCIISSCIFSFTIIFTYSLMGIVGIALAVVITVLAVFIAKAPKARLATASAVILPALAAFILSAAGLIGDGSGYGLYDGRIMWRDSYNRISASGLYDTDKMNPDSLSETYSCIYGETLDIIGDFPLTGAGPDQLVFPQLYSSVNIEENVGTFDKCYNEYLNTAASKGVPSAIALVVLVVSLIAIAFRGVREENGSFTRVCTFFMLAVGAALYLIGCSSIGVAPVFWAAAGASCSYIKTAVTKAQSNKHKKVYGN
ncbi:MAG: O-antigen ligase family protein [Ruminococcus sp.]|nr:O-antigen ligase family protein [Ruminococcus sp.]